MKDVDASIQASLDFKIESLRELILQRFQSLTTISGISFAVGGIILTTNSQLIHHVYIATSATIILLAVALISLGRYLYVLREDIRHLSSRINKIMKGSYEPEKLSEFKSDYWPEALYACLFVATCLYALSFLSCNIF